MKKIKLLIIAKSMGLYINFLSVVNPGKGSLLAYKLFSQPRTGRLTRENLPDVLKEATMEIFIYNEHSFQAYHWKGNEYVVLLVHGWESNASRWEKLLPYLKKSGSTIIAIDAPAHGLSSGKEFNVPQYAAFIDLAAKKFRPNSIIGHSIGGAACIYYQYQYQNLNLQKMVLLGAPSDLKTLIQNYIDLLSLNAKTAALLEDYFLQNFRISIEAFSGKIFSKKITTKGIIVHDVNDDVVSIDEGKKIAGSWKNATLIETRGLGHSMHDEALYDKVCEFLFVD